MSQLVHKYYKYIVTLYESRLDLEYHT